MSKTNTPKQPAKNERPLPKTPELPDGATTMEENGRTYYVYPPTGFKTPHLNHMERHVAHQTKQAKSASSQADPKAAVAKESNS